MAPPLNRKWLITGAVAGGLLVLYGPGLLRWAELTAQRYALQSEIASLKIQNQYLLAETRRLREDPAYLEAVARRELGFVRPGETVVKFKNRKALAQKNQTSEPESQR